MERLAQLEVQAQRGGFRIRGIGGVDASSVSLNR